VSASRILIVDDTPANVTLLSDALEPLGYELFIAANGESALKVAARAKPDLILLDVMMTGADGFTVCERLKADPALREVPVIFLTAKQDPASVLRGFRAGAVDYVIKPFQVEEVLSRVATHLRISQLTRELQVRNHELEAEIGRRRKAEERLSTLTAGEAQRWDVAGFIGQSPHLQRILADIERLQQFGKTTVLITGESGTGKELVARALHHHSPRTGGPFVAVNCVAVPGELAESLFFGHLKGSFTGATSDRKGYFELADGGTLFLDEIGDMPLVLQAKLLRVLEDGEVTPVGSNTSRPVDVRVVAATNADLAAKIAAGSFRQDLYFRLARYALELPPLRERHEDVPLLASHFLAVFATEMGRTPPALTREAKIALSAHAWPGNVRELKNVMERALIMSGGQAVGVEHLQLMPIARGEPARLTAPVGDLPLNLERAEQALIQRALEESGGNVAEAARKLGVNRSRIYRRFPQQAEQ
jgi:DNA-binding NtrC family response regulator